MMLDPYAVRKMLPRVVVAVIAIQLSWELCQFLIGLANDVGVGIRDILLQPFGGPGNLDLNSILRELNPAWAGASQPLLLLALFGSVILTAVFLPGVFVLALSLFIGVFMAFAVLLFRNALIIALVLFVPIALLLWILPGQSTQRYWKFWSDNFTKLLMLFPLLMIIIYTGRIFAWIVASTGESGPMDYLIVLVAYFAPYFIIFKAYKWGGGMLSAAGTAMSSAKGRFVRASTPTLRTLGDRAQGNIANRYQIGSEKYRRARALLEEQQANNRSPETIAKTQALVDRLGRKDKWRRAFYKTAAGYPLPTQRAQIETLAKAQGYKDDLVKKKEGLIHNDFVEEMNRNGGNVQGAKAYVLRKWGKDSWKEDDKGRLILDERGDAKVRDAYTERAMQNWFVDTKSAMEMGDEVWRQGGVRQGEKLNPNEFMDLRESGGRLGSLAHLNPTNSEATAKAMSDRSDIAHYWSDPTLSREDILMGRKPRFDMAKTTGFLNMMNADPQRYAYVAERLPTLQPFNQALGGGPMPEEYRPAVINTSGAEIITAGARAPAGLAPVQVSDYLPGGAKARLNPTGDAARAEALATEEAHKIGGLAADDARYVKWQKNMETPRQYAAVRPEEYQVMASIKEQLEELGLKSEAADMLHQKLEELSESKGVEGISIVQQMMGGEKSARGAITDMFGTGYLEGKLGVSLRDEVVKEAGGRIATLTRHEELQDETHRQQLKQALLDDALRTDREGQMVGEISREFVQTLSEPEEYARQAHGTEHSEYYGVLTDLRGSAAGSQRTAEAFNNILDGVISRINSRVQRDVRTAVSQGGLSPEDVQRIGAEARAEAAGVIAHYDAMRLTPPSPDASLEGSVDLHPEGDKKLITPDSPGWREQTKRIPGDLPPGR